MANQQVQPKGRGPEPARPKLTKVKPSQASPGEKPDQTPGAKGGKKKMLIIVVLALVLAGGGFFGYRRLRQPGKKGVPAALSSGPQTTYTLSAITVNLADTVSTHFLRIGVVLQYPAEDKALGAELKKQEYKIDDRIISDLRAKTYAQLSTDQGEAALKQELLHTVNGIVTKGRISGVFFDQFLIQ